LFLVSNGRLEKNTNGSVDKTEEDGENDVRPIEIVLLREKKLFHFSNLPVDNVIKLFAAMSYSFS